MIERLRTKLTKKEIAPIFSSIQPVKEAWKIDAVVLQLTEIATAAKSNTEPEEVRSIALNALASLVLMKRSKEKYIQYL